MKYKRDEDAFNACVNILAVEYLVKENNEELYGKYIDKLYKIFKNYNEKVCAFECWSIFYHIINLGEMITQDDYDSLKEELLDKLEEE